MVVTAPSLVARARESVLLLAFVLLTSAAVLIPGQSRDALGIELLAFGLLVLLIVGVGLRTATTTNVTARQVALRGLLAVSGPLLALVAGISLLAESGGGLNWWAGAVFLAYAAALLGAWVLLVEVLR